MHVHPVRRDLRSSNFYTLTIKSASVAGTKCGFKARSYKTVAYGASCYSNDGVCLQLKSAGMVTGGACTMVLASYNMLHAVINAVMRPNIAEQYLHDDLERKADTW